MTFPTLGSTASLTRTFTEADVRAFAHLSGDVNPLHLDKEFAERSIFGERIVHGALLGGLISAVLGTWLPGPGTIYRSQETFFLAPVRLGQEVTAIVCVVGVDEARRRVTLSTQVVRGDGVLAMDGEAVVQMAREAR